RKYGVRSGADRVSRLRAVVGNEKARLLGVGAGEACVAPDHGFLRYVSKKIMKSAGGCMKGWTYLLAGVAVCSLAIAEEDIASRVINKETNGAWYFQPGKPKAQVIKAPVGGGCAFRAKRTAGKHRLDVHARSPIAWAVKAGH